MNTENVSPRLCQKDIDKREIRSFAEQRRPESASSISMQIGHQKYFKDPKRSIPVANELKLEVMRQSTQT